MPVNLLRTLQGKFTFYLSILIIATMSALGYWNISSEKALLEKAINREATALVESLAISCTNTMLYEEVGLVEEGGLLDNYILDLVQRKDLKIIYAMILDPKGKVLAHNSMVEVGNSYQDEISKRALASWSTILQYPSADVLDISTPLAISTKRWGSLRIGISLENLRKETASLALKYILYTGAVILLVTGVIAFLFGFVTGPLKSLSREMDGIRVGADPPFLSPAQAREDEVGTLRRSCYGLLQRIVDDEKEREKTQRKLFLAEKMVAIGKLTSGVAHEINNPLGGLLNCIYHFKRGELSPGRQKEYLQLMEDGIKRIQETVKSLLEYAHTPRLERSPVDCALIIESSLSLLDYPIRQKGISVLKDFPERLPSVEADRNQISQVFMNVFLNAIQAMEGGGTLGIAAWVSENRFFAKISDTGKGISEEILPKVFDPFYTTKGEGKGTGLGLWITQGIVERHGGTIRLSSREGKGTTVEIQFPLHSK